MSRMAILGLFAFASFAFAGQKGQVPSQDTKSQTPAKAQAPSAPVKGQDAGKGATPARILTITETVREYAPFQKHRRLFFKQVGPTKVSSVTEFSK